MWRISERRYKQMEVRWEIVLTITDTAIEGDEVLGTVEGDGAQKGDGAR